MGYIDIKKDRKMARYIKREESILALAVSPDENVITLDDEGWAQLMEAMDRPARSAPAIAALLRQKAPWDWTKLAIVRALRPMEGSDRSLTGSFNCQEPELNDWLTKFAWLSHTSRSAAVYISLDTPGQQIAAYYSLSSGTAQKSVAPDRIGQGMPQQVPIQLIGRLAVDRRFENRGIGKHLVLDALKKTLEISKLTGVRALMVQSKPKAIEFYRKLDFEQSKSDPLLFFFLVKDIQRVLDEAGSSLVP
jgi:GNAT superfamily N-acetyltransferase